MYNQKEISQKEHLDYIKTLEDRKDKLYFLVKQANEYIGVIDFTNINSTKQSAHIGLYANPNTKGVGNTLMETICKYRFKHLTAEAFADNKKAISLYKKFGFRQFDTKMVNDKMVICMNKIVGNK
jgi:UDP-4-amino-4,6-dideoxy-N-acetyl-beta-L-altrosamine N-acetyltransferase